MGGCREVLEVGIRSGHLHSRPVAPCPFPLFQYLSLVYFQLGPREKPLSSYSGQDPLPAVARIHGGEMRAVVGKAGGGTEGGREKVWVWSDSHIFLPLFSRTGTFFFDDEGLNQQIVCLAVVALFP